MRGTGRGYLREPGRGRITPACAGNRAQPLPPPDAARDHPRVCGEQKMMELAASYVAGSPPRVRGTEMHDMYQRFHIGITPACAGNSYLSLFFTTPIQDHPRVCGEQAARPGRMHPALGSPPRVRGTAFSFSLLAIDTRITPACAGNSPPFCMQIGCLGDHPRVCGEQGFPEPTP